MTLKSGAARPLLSLRALFGPIAAIFLLSGCGAIDHIYTPYYKSLSFSEAQMIRDGIAIMPVSSPADAAEFRLSAQKIFVKSVRNLRKDLPFTSPEESEKKAIDAGVYGPFRELLSTEFGKEVPRLQLIRQVGHALDKRFIMRPELTLARQSEGATRLILRVQIWDVDLGEMVWEGSEDSSGYVVLIFPQSPAPVEKVLEVASAGLVKKIP
ncbi:MAG TPA: hypothetical protein VN944_10180 [Nitrospiria bacterium]|nr:hypothetical protein [Nitrospiria bacterium]